jgi:hypothetical protein
MLAYKAQADCPYRDCPGNMVGGTLRLWDSPHERSRMALISDRKWSDGPSRPTDKYLSDHRNGKRLLNRQTKMPFDFPISAQKRFPRLKDNLATRAPISMFSNVAVAKGETKERRYDRTEPTGRLSSSGVDTASHGSSRQCSGRTTAP